MTRSTAQIEYETEASRERVSDLLDELRERLSPGVVVDQFLGYAKDGAGRDFVGLIGNQVRKNPMACAAIGLGLAMLLMSDKKVRYSADGSTYHASESGGVVQAATKAVGAVTTAMHVAGKAASMVSSVAGK